MQYKQRALRLLALPLAAGALLAAQAGGSAPSGTLTISGDVTSVTLTAADLATMPRQTLAIQEPEGETSYEGVALQEVLKKAGVAFGRELRGKALAGYVLAEARDGYQVVFSLGELDADLGGARIIVADKRAGKPLFAYQGPLRLVVATDKRPARSVRMLERLQVVRLRK
ncbi:MAG TPA: molybdopterin-dependent oxidoreductase [Bryobacteraceae bacterium]|nr:molybdopterin-dependent oxidoreductase [Bryobacteraceae bacterium]